MSHELSFLLQKVLSSLFQGDVGKALQIALFGLVFFGVVYVWKEFKGEI